MAEDRAPAGQEMSCAQPRGGIFTTSRWVAT
jgi:hypothetical protein